MVKQVMNLIVHCFWLLWELSGRALFFGFQGSAKGSDSKMQQPWINAMPKTRVRQKQRRPYGFVRNTMKTIKKGYFSVIYQFIWPY